MKSVSIEASNCKYYAPELFIKFSGKKIMIGYQCAECEWKACVHHPQAHGNKDRFALAILAREEGK